jgi:Icc protein
MKLAWSSDIHLDFPGNSELLKYLESLQHLSESGAEALIISGDIGESQSICRWLEVLDKASDVPIYFILGNHDFYGSSISEVRNTLRTFVPQLKHTKWVTSEGVIRLSDNTALVGHDGWYDGRYGNYWSPAEFLLNDFYKILEFKNAYTKHDRFSLMNKLGDEAAEFLRDSLKKALDTHEHVVCVTHVPPFERASIFQGKTSPAHSMPFFSCKAIGGAIGDVIAEYDEKRVTVMCGHTHEPADVLMLPNLRVMATGAEYGLPKVCVVSV